MTQIEAARNRIPVKLKRGNYYIIRWSWDYKNKIICKFIQPTKCGYNFLDINTNKCILRQHLYLDKKCSIWYDSEEKEWVCEFTDRGFKKEDYNDFTHWTHLTEE